MRYEQIKPLEEMQLDEIRMSPASLRQLASQIDARAGMEFEMIVPDAQGDDDDLEPDYDQDQRCRSIEDAVEFFHDGDYNSRSDVQRLERRMMEGYQDWVYEQISDDWDRYGFEFFCEYLDREDPFDEDEALDTARDSVIDSFPDLEQDSDKFRDLVRERLDELQAEYYQEQWEEQGRNYDYAREEYEEEQRDEYDEASWLDALGIRMMSAVGEEFDIQWPYWTSGGDGREVSEVGNSFEAAIGKPVISSKSYHSATRKPGHYIVEPDGSLDGDNPGDSGLEFVSPPMSIPELFADLRIVKSWADSEGCYTNRSTGLHMNISVPSLEGDVSSKLDYVKLALLLGDNYVLEQFGRTSNTYCKSALEKVKSAVKKNPDQAKDLLTQMKGHLGQLASKAVHGSHTDKYTSINTKGGYVEFRSPGGDWLNENFDLIENTMLRFVVALDAACDPTKYREEYLKKLYKLLDPEGGEARGGKDTIQYFADYVAGNMPKAALRSFVKQAQLERKLSKGNMGADYWWEVSNPPHSHASIQVVARTKEEAIEKALEQDGYPSWANTRQTIVAKPLRPFDASPLKAKAGEPESLSSNQSGGNWGIWITGADRFSRAAGQMDNSVLRRFPTRQAAESWIEQQRAERPDMRTDIEVREIEPAQPIPGSTLDLQRQRAQQFQEPNSNRGDLTPHGPGPWEIYRISDGSSVRELSHTNRSAAEQEARSALGLRGEAPELYGVRTRQQSQQQTFTGEWDVVMGGQVVFRVRGENQSIANQAAREWILGRSREFLNDHQGEEVEVVPRYS